MQKKIDHAVAEISTVLLGKEKAIRLALCCLIAKGHLLIEDLPGMGKTTLSQALAKVLGLQYKRVQFTSDILPADILGVSIFDRKSANFQFMPGPIFTQVLLADEINRTSPKSQSALLEAMEEGQVTIEGSTRELPAPFFVIATQNPSNQAGTYPLPESQLDRFLMRLSLGYPDREAERKLLLGEDTRKKLHRLQAIIDVHELVNIQKAVDEVHCSDNLIDYVQRLVEYSRFNDNFPVGISPRGAQALLCTAKAWALMSGRGHTVPEDVQIVLPSVVEHRLSAMVNYQSTSKSLSRKLLEEVSVII
ncbi:MAG: AAA family ATPase [Spongiibacteraceae bacterium]